MDEEDLGRPPSSNVPIAEGEKRESESSVLHWRDETFFQE